MLKYPNIYFIGIGGIGMSALARWFNANGFQVAGYDKTPTPLTENLIEEGIPVHFEDDLSSIDPTFTEDTEKTLVIYTPAVPSSHTELLYFRERSFKVIKRAEALGLITKDSFTIGVAGTHGKTTTSSMLSHVLTQAGYNCSAFLGGISSNYNTNMLLGDASKEDHIVVVEADEFDRSFLHLNPDIEIITSVEADHLDIYGDEDSVFTSFDAFAQKLDTDNGYLISQHQVKLPFMEHLKQKVSYGIEKGDYSAQNIGIASHAFTFDLHKKENEGVIHGIKMMLPGYHNIENATAVASACLRLGLTDQQIKEGLESYLGVKRRFEYHIKSDNTVLIDDYAHHPTEVEAFISSVKALYPEESLTVIFQPHLYSRTRDFANGFAKSLSLADEVILLPIYPARELPIEGVDAALIASKITHDRKKIVDKSALIDHILQSKSKVIATVGAGDIDQMVPQIKERLL